MGYFNYMRETTDNLIKGNKMENITLEQAATVTAATINLLIAEGKITKEQALKAIDSKFAALSLEALKTLSI